MYTFAFKLTYQWARTITWISPIWIMKLVSCLHRCIRQHIQINQFGWFNLQCLLPCPLHWHRSTVGSCCWNPIPAPLSFGSPVPFVASFLMHWKLSSREFFPRLTLSLSDKLRKEERRQGVVSCAEGACAILRGWHLIHSEANKSIPSIKEGLFPWYTQACLCWHRKASGVRNL